jgi:hypothetical protein
VKRTVSSFNDPIEPKDLTNMSANGGVRSTSFDVRA